MSVPFHTAKEVGRTLDQFSDDVNKALKGLNENERRIELQNYESLIGPKALHAALEKFKDHVSDELRALVSKHRANELASYEAAAGKKALGAAKKSAA